MFDWLKSKFGSGTTQLTAAATRLNKAQTAYGNTNSRKIARNTAEQLEASATATKATVELAKKNLKSILDRCSSEQDIAEQQLEQAQRAHNKVKDTTLQKIGRLVTVGRAGWGSRTAAVNAAQKRQANNITKRRETLRVIAEKQKAAMEKEEAARKERAALINRGLGIAKDVSVAANAIAVTPTPQNRRANRIAAARGRNGTSNLPTAQGIITVNSSGTARTQTNNNYGQGNNNNSAPLVGHNLRPLSGGRRGTRGRKTRGRR
jgi:hypothetical protein